MKRRATRGLGACAALALFASGCGPVPEPPLGMSAESEATGGELFDYVAAPDPAYEWHERSRYAHGSTQIVELRLHSQTWRGTLWKHQLFLIRPQNVALGGNALLIIGGGRWNESAAAAAPPSEPPDGAAEFVAMAEALQTVVAVVGTVPFQPLLGLTEDDLIAHTFDRYLNEGDADWPLLLPMVKSAVRAMDAVQAASDALWSRRIDGFTVVGGSKRGWTAWLTAAVDARVLAIAPLVFDALDMAEHFPHQSAVWGAPSEKIRPYTALNLHETLSSADGERLRRIVDPYAYRTRLTLPKLIINATNDEYFPVDSLNLYWDGLEEPKYLLYLANQPHSIDDLGFVVPSLAALHRAVSGGVSLADVAWQYDTREGGLMLCVRATPEPTHVAYWLAESRDRDFRDARWLPNTLERREGTYIIDLARPEKGYVAVYADLSFDGAPAPYRLSTAVAVMSAAAGAAVTPFPANHGRVCDASVANSRLHGHLIEAAAASPGAGDR